MATKGFDWRSLAASDEELAKHRQEGSLYASGDPAAWKTGIVAAYFKEDYLARGAKKRGVGILDVAAAPLALTWNLLFGFPKSERVDYVIGPEEAALVVRDGKIVGTYNQARLKTGGTFMEWLKSNAGDKPNYRLLLADCSPFDVQIPFSPEHNPLVSRDGDVITGRARIRLKVDPEHLENLLGMLRGRPLLHVADFAETIEDKLIARVLVPHVKEHPTAQIRGNVGLLDKIRAECRKEVETAYREVGIILDDLDVSWELSEEERLAISERKRDLAERAEIAEAEREKRATARETEVEGTKRELEANLAHQDRMRELLHAKERDIESAQGELERIKAQTELQRARMELEGLQADHRRLQERLDREQNLDLELKETEMALRLKSEKRRIEREDDLIRQQAGQAHELDLLERYKGLTSDQLLAIRSAESPEAARALAEKFKAEAAKAEESTRRVLDLADKQVDQGHKMARDFGEQMGRVAESAATVKSGGVPATCEKCGEGIQPHWKVCPHCGQKFSRR